MSYGAFRLYLHFFAVGAFSTVSALFIAGLFSRTEITGFFTLKMLAVLPFVSALGSGVVFLVTNWNTTQYMPGRALFIVLDGIMTGLFMFLSILPVMMLILGNEFYRKRLKTLLGIGQYKNAPEDSSTVTHKR
jgi:hypothetical protein